MIKNYKEFKQEIEKDFSEVEEINGVLTPVEFDPAFSHDIVLKKKVEECILSSELHKKPKPNKRKIDNRFLSEKMRGIMFLPTVIKGD